MLQRALDASLLWASWLSDASIAAALIVVCLWLPLLLAFPIRRITSGGEERNHDPL
jgi:di/tricarboxylate transporter